MGTGHATAAALAHYGARVEPGQGSRAGSVPSMQPALKPPARHTDACSLGCVAVGFQRAHPAALRSAHGASNNPRHTTHSSAGLVARSTHSASHDAATVRRHMLLDVMARSRGALRDAR